MTAAGAPLLEVRGLSAGYEGVPVVHDLDLEVAAGEVVVLLGANGAGKTTTLLAVSGLVAAAAGDVRYLGTSVARRRPSLRAVAALARRGMVHVPEDRGLFNDLTVGEHLRLARRRGDDAAVDAALDRLPALADLVDRRAGLLSGGEAQMLALARALVARPRLLMVDELSLGLAPLVVEGLLPVLREIAAEDGVGVLLVEQHVALALGMADRGLLLRRGRCVAEGPAGELAHHLDQVAAGYFGDDADDRL